MLSAQILSSGLKSTRAIDQLYNLEISPISSDTATATPVINEIPAATDTTSATNDATTTLPSDGTVATLPPDHSYQQICIRKNTEETTSV